MQRPRLPRLSYANITATLALIAACSGTAVAVAPTLADNSVSARAIKPKAVHAVHIAPGAVRNRHVADNAIDATQIRGAAARLRGPLPVGAGGRITVQAASTPSLARVRVAAALAGPSSIAGFPGDSGPACTLGGCYPGPVMLGNTPTASSTATCPQGTVLLSGGAAISNASAPGAFTRSDGSTGTGTWALTVSAGQVTVNQDAQSVSVTATVGGTFTSPADPRGSYSGQQPRNWTPFQTAAPAISAPATPVAGLGVQAVAYCLELVEGS